MSMVDRMNAFRADFQRRHGREPTAKEVADGLRVPVARPDTIRKAIEAQGPEPTKSIEHVYNLRDRKQDYHRCVQALQQLQS